jgi:hypothetical protein
MFNEKVLSVTDYTGSQYRICFHLPKKKMKWRRKEEKEKKKKKKEGRNVGEGRQPPVVPSCAQVMGQ